MIIIGEKINATRKAIAEAVEARDEQHIIATAVEQVAAGADYLDVNGGNPVAEKEVANMRWLVELVQTHTEAALCIDSANVEAMDAGLAAARSKPILNSISLESDRLEAFLPLLAKYECMVIGLCMSDEGTPAGVADRVERAAKLIEHFTAAGRQVAEIIIDPCFFPASAEPASVAHVCGAMAEIRKQFPEVHLGGGLSNSSYGLPNRRLVNLAMLSLATYHGLDAPIIDPCVRDMVPLARAAEVLSGADEWCVNYVAAHRAGKL